MENGQVRILGPPVVVGMLDDFHHLDQPALGSVLETTNSDLQRW